VTPKKRLNIDQITSILKYLVSFNRTILSYNVMIYIFMFDTLKSSPFLFENDRTREFEGQKVYELEYTFLTNFQLINRDFKNDKVEKIWVDYLLEPLLKAERDSDFLLVDNNDIDEFKKKRFVQFLDPVSFVDSMLLNKLITPDENRDKDIDKRSQSTFVKGSSPDLTK